MMQLDYEDTSVLLLPNRNGNDSENNEDDDDEYNYLFKSMNTN